MYLSQTLTQEQAFLILGLVHLWISTFVLDYSCLLEGFYFSHSISSSFQEFILIKISLTLRFVTFWDGSHNFIIHQLGLIVVFDSISGACLSKMFKNSLLKRPYQRDLIMPLFQKRELQINLPGATILFQGIYSWWKPHRDVIFV